MIVSTQVKWTVNLVTEEDHFNLPQGFVWTYSLHQPQDDQIEYSNEMSTYTHPL